MAIRNSKRKLIKAAAEARPRPEVPLVKANTEQGEKRLPNYDDLVNAKPVDANVYELTKQEIQTVRSRVYALNKHNAFGWRWRTLVEPAKGLRNQLLVWRIH